MVCKSGHHGDGCGFLSSSVTGSGYEEASVFPSELSSGPELAGRVPECLEEKTWLVHG